MSVTVLWIKAEITSRLQELEDTRVELNKLVGVSATIKQACNASARVELLRLANKILEAENDVLETQILERTKGGTTNGHESTSQQS